MATNPRTLMNQQQLSQSVMHEFDRELSSINEKGVKNFLNEIAIEIKDGELDAAKQTLQQMLELTEQQVATIRNLKGALLIAACGAFFLCFCAAIT